MARQTLKEHAVEHGLGSKTAETTDAVLLEQADGQAAYAAVSTLVTFAILSANGAVGPGSSQVAAGDHTHGTGGLENGAVTYAKMQDVSAASKLLGRGDGGAGTVQELSLGAGLSVAGTTLSASGSGLPADDTTALVQDPADNTKRARIDAGAISTSTTRAIIMGDRDVDLGSNGTFAEKSHNHTLSDITDAADVVTFENLDGNGDVGTGADQVAAGDHTHAQLHDRSHAVTSASDHTATAHRLFYSDASGNVQELAFGTSGQRLQSNGASSAPSFTDPAVGVQSPELDSGDYSSTPKTMADEWGVHRIFTGAQNHIIEFPAGLTVGANGFLYAPTANTLELRRVDDSGVSIDGVASNGALGDAFVIPAGTSRFWIVTAPNTILTDIGRGGGTAGDLSIPGAATFEDTVNFSGNVVSGNLAGTSAASMTLTDADSGKIITTTGNVTVPTTAGFNVTLIAGGAHTVGNGTVTSAAMAAGDVMSVFNDASNGIHAVLTASANKVSFS